jgi:hypothetical protein
LLSKFFDKGNENLTDQIDKVRVGSIAAVNTAQMTAEVTWLDDKGGRTKVPLSMPMVGPGFGIMAVPTRGTIVAVGMRAMQMPLILAYYPATTPSSRRCVRSSGCRTS